MGVHGDKNVETTRRPAALTRLALAADANLSALIDASGNAHGKMAGAAYLPPTFTFMAWCRDDLAAPFTLRAVGRINDGAEGTVAHDTDTARTIASITADGCFSRLRAASISDRAD